MKTHSLPNQELILFLKPEEPTGGPSYEIDLCQVFREILQRANDFVPSQAGTIFIRDATSESEPELLVAAAFGEDGERLVGERLAVDEGIAGYVFQEGQVYVSATPSSVALLAEPEASEATAAQVPQTAGSVVALPLTAASEVVGVLELLKDRGGEPFDEHELELLEVFAHTISVSISNAIEAQRSKEMARRDELTHLFNDRYLHHALTSTLETALGEELDCGLLFLDLDHFKNINDNFGHLIGSRVLREIGDLLRQVLPGPAVPARYGGDEFVVILPESSKQEVFWVAETIRKTIETNVFLEHPDPKDPINYPGLQLSGITCSVGLATLTEDTLPLLESRAGGALGAKNELIRLADTRMYRAKDQGRNRTVSAEEEVEAAESAQQ